MKEMGHAVYVKAVILQVCFMVLFSAFQLSVLLLRPVKQIVINPILSQVEAIKLLESTVSVCSGTGVVFESVKDGDHYKNRVITNYHVIANVDSRSITVGDFTLDKYKHEIISTTRFQSRLILINPIFDLAIVEFISRYEFRSVKFCNDLSSLPVYEPVYAVGCGLGFPPHVTNGNVAVYGLVNSIITAPCIFGNSGSGVYTSSGEMIGLVVSLAKSEDPDGIFHPITHLINIISVETIKNEIEISKIIEAR